MSEIKFEADELRELVRVVVSEVLADAEQRDSRLNGRMAYLESQAADLMGVPVHSLRDCRLRGEINHTRIGRRVAYTRKHLEEFLRANEGT